MSNGDNLSKFGITFQTKAISVMLTDRSFLDQAQDIIEPKHFESDAHKWIVEKIMWYFDTYKDIPSMEVFKKEMDKENIKDNDYKVNLVQSLKDVYKNSEASDIRYIKDEYLEFCRNQAFKGAILKAADQLQSGNYDKIKTLVDKAMHAGQERNYGHNWKEDIAQRLVHVARETVPTGWQVINQIMDGGLAAGELGVIVAPPGIGKSWGLVSLGRHAVENGKKVLHYTLELNENYLGLRYDTMFTGYEPNQVRHHMDEVRTAISKITGELIIKYYPTRSVTSHSFAAHIERLMSTGFEPDLILVDYADLLRPSEKADARYQELGIVYEDLRGMGGQFKIPVWTASQSQRSSMKDDVIEGDKIAESFNKIMTADFLMSISRKMADKVSSTARIHIIKNRFGPDGMTFPAHVNFVEGKFDIYDEESAEGIRIKKQMQEGDNVVKTLLQKKLLQFRNEQDESDDLG